MKIRLRIKQTLLCGIVITIAMYVAGVTGATGILGIVELQAKTATLPTDDTTPPEGPSFADLSSYILMHQTSGVPTLYAIAAETATCAELAAMPTSPDADLH